MPPYQFFACRDKTIINNVAFFVLTFSFDVFGRFWAKKIKKIGSWQPQEAFFLVSAAILAISKITF